MGASIDGNGSNNTANSPVIKLTSPTERPPAGSRGEVHEVLVATSQEELPTSSIASPPYKSVASSPNLRFLLPGENNHYAEYPPSPDYQSPSRINLLEEDLMRQKDQAHQSQKKETFVEDERQKPSVHYSENIKPFQYAGMRQDSVGDYMSSRASSIAGTEDEDSEDYDWSGEEDLVDEEAKFEKQMGVKSKLRGWGPRR